jgi:hypothetical protein
MDFKEFLKSLVRSVADGLRHNKLPTTLACVVAVAVTAAFALTSDFDERPRFRKMTLPQIDKAEQQFFNVMDEAERETDELRRLHYFLEGHRRAKAALQTLTSERPVTASGRKAHRELVRYYELVDEEIAIIRTEMSLKPSFDYIGEWKRRNTALAEIRERWVKWLR